MVFEKVDTAYSFTSLFLSPFSLLSLPSLQDACYLMEVESRRGELQNVCSIYLLTSHNFILEEEKILPLSGNVTGISSPTVTACSSSLNR